MTRNNFRSILVSAGLVFSLSSCLKEATDDISAITNVGGIQSDVGITLPLLDAQISIKDIYDSTGSTFVKIENDQSFTFVYSSSSALEQREFITMEPLGVSYELNVDANTATVFNAAGSFSNSISNYAVFPTTNGEKLKQIFIKRGSFSFNVTCDILHHTRLVFVYPTIHRFGKPLMDTLDLVYEGTNPIVVNREVSLDDYVIDLTDNGISYNVLPYLFELSLDKVPGNPPVAAGDAVKIVQSFEINETRGINGYVGKFLLQKLQSENPIDLFEDQKDISVQLKDPRLKFKIYSGFGIPITMKINKIAMVNNDGTEFPIQIGFLADTFSLPAPTTIGGYAIGDFVIDRNNSNLDQIINNALQNAPKAVKYDVEVYSNYNNIEVDNFMFDTSSLKVDVGMEIPLDLKVGNFSYTAQDTLTLPNDAAFELKEIKFATLATNTLPLNIRIQYYFGRYNPLVSDSTEFEIVDSLFNNGFVLSKATVDTNGNVVQSPPVLSEAIMDRNKFIYLRDVAKVNKSMFKLSFETSRDASNNQQFVKVYNTQGLGLKMGISVKGKQKQKF